MARTIQFEGRSVSVPDDATDEEVAEILSTSAPAPAPTAPAAPAESPGFLGTMKDAAQSLGSGAVRGLTETAMLPVTAERLLHSGSDWLYSKIMGHGPAPDMSGIRSTVNSGQDAVRSGMDATLHKPETRTGKFANTIGEFMAPGALPSRAARGAPTFTRMASQYLGDLAGNVVVPAVTSEGAGELASGAGLPETPARIVGALAGNAGVALGRSYNAPEAVVRRTVGDLTDDQWQQALDLQNNPTGVRLTGPEAIAQATGGGSAAPDVLRVVEGSIEGRSRTAPFFAQRPQQVDSAVGGFLDQIAPQSPTPSVLGPRAAEAADTVLDRARQDINQQTRPAYQAAEAHVLDPADFEPIARDPAFQASLQRLRNNEVLGPIYAGQPDNSVAVIDAVTKDMTARGTALQNSANEGFNPQVAARYGSGASEARDIARDPTRGGVAEYDAALAQQEQLRRDVLQPLQEGPVGRVAAAKDTTGAGNAILPANPLTGSGGETADAVTRLVAQDADTTSGLVRQNLGDRYARASTETQGMSRENSGAKFHKDVAGNANKRENLDAVLGALPNAPAPDDVALLLNVLEATGRRKPVGSMTAFNNQIAGDVGEASLGNQMWQFARSLGTSAITQATDAAKRAAYRGNIGELADMFTHPQSVELMRNTLNTSVPVNVRGTAGRTAAEVLPMLFR